MRHSPNCFAMKTLSLKLINNFGGEVSYTFSYLITLDVSYEILISFSLKAIHKSVEERNVTHKN